MISKWGEGFEYMRSKWHIPPKVLRRAGATSTPVPSITKWTRNTKISMFLITPADYGMTNLYLISDVGHVLTPLAPPNYKAAARVCARHGRERRKVLGDKPAKPVRSIHPKLVKPVQQAREKLEAAESKDFQPQPERKKSVSETLVSGSFKLP